MKTSAMVRYAMLRRALSRALHGALLTLGLVAVAARASAQQRADFPHEKHARLFPTCQGCHAGIPTEDQTTRFPAVATCATCHDGVQQPKTTWSGRIPGGGNLHFSHASHASKVPAAQAECVACHATPGAPFMAARRAPPAGCLSCHEHQASAHLASDQPCLSCHVTLTQAPAMSAAKVARFPKPPSHTSKDFASSHGPEASRSVAQCSVCHARESCERCHANAGTVPAIAGLGRDVRIATAVAFRSAAYATPASHTRGRFINDHGRLASANIASCANCHTQPSCTACHIGTLGRVAITHLPLPVPGGAQGVRMERAPNWSVAAPARQSNAEGTRFLLASRGPAPSARDTIPRDSLPAATPQGIHRVQPHPRDFTTTHSGEAASGRTSCAGCHTQQQFCTDCHAGNEGRRRFHAMNFVSRHAADSWGREKDCSTCHNPELFCRNCHASAGLASRGRLDVAYHTAQPLWLLQHGRAARQSLQSCTTCHTQVDCMQCHSSTGWKVNPHGANFDAQRQWRANRLVCLRCHQTDPITGG